MTDKELRKLRRDDLLQILISQQRQLDEANAELEQLREQLSRRDIAVQEAGSVAEAAMRLNGVFEAAQSAADQYQEQMRRRADELAEQADRAAENAKRTAEDILAGARGEADRILRQAREEAERLKAQAGGQPAAQPAPAEAEDASRRHGLFRSRKS